MKTIKVAFQAEVADFITNMRKASNEVNSLQKNLEKASGKHSAAGLKELEKAADSARKKQKLLNDELQKQRKILSQVKENELSWQKKVNERKNELNRLKSDPKSDRELIKQTQAALDQAKSKLQGAKARSAEVQLDLTKKYREERAAAAEAAAAERDLARAYREVRAANRDLAAQVEAGAAARKKAYSMLGGAATVAGAALTMFTRSNVNASREFDSAMSRVKVNTETSGESLRILRDLAKDMGRNTMFNATEAADGIDQLAKAGVNAADIYGGALKGALDLAAAGELSVGDAAEIAATAVTQFHLQGKDVPHVADLLASGAAKAQGDVSDLAFAMKQGGLVANQMGLSVEDTIGTLTSFAAAGMVGSDAGTSLRTMMVHLMAPTKRSAELMESYKIRLYDAKGQFVGIEQAAGQLQNRLANVSKEERDFALATIFGMDALRGANILFEQGANGMNEWIDKVNDSGFAARAAAERMDNLAGDTKLLSGAFETAKINMGEGLTPMLRYVVQGLTDVVRWFGDLPPAVQGGVGVVTAFTGAAGLLGGAVITVIPKLVEFKKALDAIRQARAAKGLLDAASDVAEMGAAASAVSAASGKTAAKKAASEAGEEIAGGVAGGLAAGLATKLKGAVLGVLGKLKSLVKGFTLPAIVFTGLSALGNAVWDFAPDVESTRKALSNLSIDGKQAMLNLGFGTEFANSKLEDQRYWLQQAADPSVWTSLTNGATRFGDGLLKIVTLGNFDSRSGFSKFKDGLGATGKELGRIAANDLPTAIEKFKELKQAMGLTRDKDISNLLRTMPEFRDQLIMTAHSMGLQTDEATLLKLALGDIGPSAEEAQTAVIGFGTSAEEVVKQIDGAYEAVNNWAGAFLNMRSANREADNAVDSMNELIQSFYEGKASARDLEEGLDGVASASLNAITKMKDEALRDGVFSQKESDETVARAYELRDRLKDVALRSALFGDENEVDDYINNQLNFIPEMFGINIEAETEKLFSQVQGAIYTIDTMTGHVNIDGDTTLADNSLATLLGAIADKEGNIKVGAVTLPAQTDVLSLIGEVNEQNGTITVDANGEKVDLQLDTLKFKIDETNGNVVISGKDEATDEIVTIQTNLQNLVGKDYSTTINAKDNLTGPVNSWLNQIPREIGIQINRFYNDVYTPVASVGSRSATQNVSIGATGGAATDLSLARGSKALRYAGGGPIYGPGNGTSDDILAWLANGEHVLTAREVKEVGGQEAVYRMRAAIRAGMLKFSNGGSPSYSQTSTVVPVSKQPIVNVTVYAENPLTGEQIRQVASSAADSRIIRANKLNV